MTEHDRPIGLRDRLLLCFADLNSYGIDARSAVAGTVEECRARILAEVLDQHPNAIGSYVFWTKADDDCFLPSGDLRAGIQLPLYHSGSDVVRALKTVCVRADVILLGMESDDPVLVQPS